MSVLREQNAVDAFSKQAAAFDGIDAANPLIAWVRGRVRNIALSHMQAGDTLLELNAGTGIDSYHFASRGIRVLATDAAEGMVTMMQAKKDGRPGPPVEVMRCSFTELKRLGDRRFQHVFSNFGGLNCTDRLDLVLHGIDRVLLPGGTCTLVVMPPFSPWEALSLLKGNLRLATRRWSGNGTTALVEGLPFSCYYYTPGFIKRHLGKGYVVIAQRALSALVPPPYSLGFTEKWPRTFRTLSWLEDKLAHLPLVRNWGDHFVISLRRIA
ncbi:MAG: methyltransferase domain-containing protein [Flavobacteriales bacterium]|nr:methyltransferase domain-containing protein [Flavobacteriales bacterium]